MTRVHSDSRRWARPATPAERMRVKWFCIGVAFSWAVLTLLVLWVDAGGQS